MSGDIGTAEALRRERDAARAERDALAEVMRVINAHPGEPGPVFETILAKAHAVCGADFGALLTMEGDVPRARTVVNYPDDVADDLLRGVMDAGWTANFADGERHCHVPDAMAEGVPPVWRRWAEISRCGIRTMLAVAMRRGDGIVGFITAHRRGVRPYNEAEIALLEALAAQAVTAMDHARLLGELRASDQENRILVQRQAASIEVLKTISTSPSDPAPVFGMIARHARALCRATGAVVVQRDGDLLRLLAFDGYEGDAAARLAASYPRPCTPDLVAGHVALTGRVGHLRDVDSNTEFSEIARRMARERGSRALLGVPLLRDGAVLGVIVLHRAIAGGFDDDEIALAENFAAQAVIALENARLILGQREALERQTAAAEVLAVINANPGHLDPVFETILAKAHTVCGADLGALFVREGVAFRARAVLNYPAEARNALLREPQRPGQLVGGRRHFHVADALADEAPEAFRAWALRSGAGVRTMLMVALRSEDGLIGFMTAHRKEVRPYNPREIALLEQFAAQAVIAMENARLITEQREALERQTATAEVLAVINANPGQLDPVFETILAKAHAVCGADIGALGTMEGGVLRARAVLNYPAETGEEMLRRPMNPAWMDAFASGARHVHVPDGLAPDSPPAWRRWAEESKSGIRTMLGVSMRRDGKVVGLITAHRVGVRPYSDSEIALLESFADQAVIAMENARLITEQREALERQTATAEILRVINTHPGELDPVFETILERAHALCGAEIGALLLYEDGMVRPITTRGYARAPSRPGRPRPPTPYERPVLEGREDLFHMADLTAIDPATDGGLARRMVEINGGRTTIAVPFRKDGQTLGYFSVFRKEVRLFSEAEIALLRSFADQAAIAIENARLLEALRSRTAELAERNDAFRERIDHQAATIDVLKAMSASPGNPQPVFDLITQQARDLTGVPQVVLYELVGDKVHIRSDVGMRAMLEPREWGAYMASFPMDLRPVTQNLTAIVEGRLIRSADVQSGPHASEWGRRLGIRAQISVPLMRDGRAIGAIGLARTDTRDFSDSQVALAQTFAEQAVIAITSAETFRALQQRTAELAARNSAFAEQIDHQAATIDVLKAMSASPGDAQPVLDLIARHARVQSEAETVGLFLLEDGLLHIAAVDGQDMPALQPFIASFPRPPSPDLVIGRTVLEGREISIEDTDAEPGLAEVVRAHGHRSIFNVPMVRDGRVVGGLSMNLRRRGGLRETQKALARTFAEQAVIALGSAATFRALQQRTAELSESLEMQTATADVLKAINANPGNLDPVFDAILKRVMELCGSRAGALYMCDGSRMSVGRVLTSGMSEAALDAFTRQFPRSLTRATAAEQALLDRKTVYVPDVLAQPELAQTTVALGHRSVLAVPLLSDGVPIGVFGLTHPDLAGFNEAQVALVQTFAEQAVIAIRSAETLKTLQQRTAELTEALEMQTATADVLKAINANPGNLDPVFDAILTRAMALGDTSIGFIFEYDGRLLHLRTVRGYDEATRTSVAAAFPAPATPQSATGQAILARETVYVRDLDTMPDLLPSLRVGDRAVLAVPLMRDGAPIGVISLCHWQPNGFSEAHVALMQTFAEQAVIAMRGAEVLRQLQHRTAELTEALETQTATADVLKVISRSAFDLQTVLDTLIGSAVRLCEGTRGAIWLREGELFHVRADAGMTPELRALLRATPRGARDTDTAISRVLARRAPVVDAGRPPTEFERQRRAMGGAPNILAVPMMRDGKIEGVITVGRDGPSPFGQRQIDLVQTFADQAVIAIQNARLFAEVQARTAELTDALEMQTATADVLKAISRSAFDLDTVLTTLIRTATRLCDTAHGQIYRLEDGVFVYAASVMDLTPEYLEIERRQRIAPGRGTLVGRAALERQTVHIADVLEDPDYAEKAAARIGGIRTLLGVPMLRDGAVIGVFAIARTEVRPFTRQQIELVTTFADQAVIALENARLFAEVQARTAELTEALEMQTATADVLKAISRSAFDLDTVLETLTRSAATLCGTDTGNLRIRDGEGFRLGAVFGFTPKGVDYLRSVPLRPGRGSISARVAQSLAVEMVEDEHLDGELDPALLRVTPNRAVLGVPLLRDGALEGVFVLGRTQPGRFTQRQVEVVQTFADQAVIAVQNARLFKEVQARTEELSRSLNDLRAAQDRLVQTEKLASLGQLTAGIAHEIKNPLNFVNNFSSLSVELLDELQEVLAPVDGAVRAEVDDLVGMLKGNLDKVVSHGKRADGIVKNMLLHSREKGGERRAVDFNAVVEEALNLAYHGARAETPGFNITLERRYDPEIGMVELFPQEFTRVMLNLISNGFYAATRRKATAGDAGFEPVLSVATEAGAETVVVRVRDNGVGIPEAVKARLFEPFFTTKPAGEGTGLGLSLSHDIVVKQHGGSIAVESVPGDHTVFTVTIPRRLPGAGA